MPPSRLVAAVLVLVGCLGLAPAAAQAPAWPAKVPLKTRVDKSILHPMVFYLAHGEANACGPGCSEWIIADGMIDAGAANRLQAFLWQLNGARPPLFLHSPGGLVTVSIQIGRMLREHNLTVSVGHTIALNCGPAPAKGKTCNALIGAGERLEARLDPLSAMCNSACVYALAGGSVRLIPPGVSLGIHDIGFEPATGLFRPTQFAMAVSKQLADVRLHTYMHDMGIDSRLLTEAFAVPFTSVAFLSRDDAARFGLDRRDFAETVWQFYDKPMPAVRKSFFVRTGEGRYVNGVAAVFCARGSDASKIVGFGRERLSADTADIAAQPAVDVGLGGQSFAFARIANTTLYARQALLPTSAIESAADRASLVLPAAEFGRQGPSGDVKLSMLGFAPAHARLQKACTQATYAAMTLPLATSTTALIPHSVLQTMQSASALPSPSSSLPLGAGATRDQVDATLGAPTKTVGSVSLYSYMSSSNRRKVMAAYFDTAGSPGRVDHFARLVLKDGKIFDEVARSELSQGPELPAVRALLAAPVSAAAGSGAPAPAEPLSH